MKDAVPSENLSGMVGGQTQEGIGDQRGAYDRLSARCTT